MEIRKIISQVFTNLPQVYFRKYLEFVEFEQFDEALYVEQSMKLFNKLRDFDEWGLQDENMPVGENFIGQCDSLVNSLDTEDLEAFMTATQNFIDVLDKLLEERLLNDEPQPEVTTRDAAVISPQMWTRLKEQGQKVLDGVHQLLNKLLGSFSEPEETSFEAAPENASSSPRHLKRVMKALIREQRDVIIPTKKIALRNSVDRTRMRQLTSGLTNAIDLYETALGDQSGGIPVHRQEVDKCKEHNTLLANANKFNFFNRLQDAIGFFKDLTNPSA